MTEYLCGHLAKPKPNPSLCKWCMQWTCELNTNPANLLKANLNMHEVNEGGNQVITLVGNNQNRRLSLMLASEALYNALIVALPILQAQYAGRALETVQQALALVVMEPATERR